MRSKFNLYWPAFYFNNWDVGCLIPVVAKRGKNHLKCYNGAMSYVIHSLLIQISPR